MNTSLYTSMVSMGAVQQKLDLISRNMANLNTYGYKRMDASFDDILTDTVRQTREMQQLPGRLTPPGFILGNGVRMNEQQMFLQQGNITQTGNPLDLAIIGDGFFEVELREDLVPNAQGVEVPRAAYTRDGAFKLTRSPDNPNVDLLSTADGRFVRGRDDRPIEIPRDAEVSIDQKGFVSAKLANGQHVPSFAQIKVVQVIKPQMLENVGDNLFTLPINTGVNNAEFTNVVDFDDPVENSAMIEQRALETSNVNLSIEMTELITTQRSFQLLARALSTSDTMMGMANSLRA